MIETNEDWIEVVGAREHNLKNIDVRIPRNHLTVITGLSGSGKSSLAFDTIYAEGQRRYIETFSAYARRYIGSVERPDVDEITGLSPVIAIEQKTVSHNPRSTVGTSTELFDFLRLLFVTCADAYSPVTGESMVQYSEKKILSRIQTQFADQNIYILTPVIRGRKGHYRELFAKWRSMGYLHVRVDGEIREITPNMSVERYSNHRIELVIDRLKVEKKSTLRLKESVALALKMGKGSCMMMSKEEGEPKFFSKNLVCPTSGIAFDNPQPHTFSFNSPLGACTRCNGLGNIPAPDMDKMVPDKKKSIKDGAIELLGKAQNSTIFLQIEAVLKKHNFSLKTPFKELSEEAIRDIFYGSPEKFSIQIPRSHSVSYSLSFDGLFEYLDNLFLNASSTKRYRWVNFYLRRISCPDCQGKRLKKESLCFRIAEKDIAELAQFDLNDLSKWLQKLPSRMNKRQQRISHDILRELNTRIGFLIEVGLDYLSLHRTMGSLSGGESQRIRLASQIGAQLVNVLYILDEPSIGLHQRDNEKLIKSLQHLRDIGNTVVVVEHDKGMMLQSDYLIDLGPAAGRHGGKVVAADVPQNVLKMDGMTSDFLSGKRTIEANQKPRNGSGKILTIQGAEGNNLKKIEVSFPLGMLLCITGVSGSGKSSLVNGILYPALHNHLNRTEQNVFPYQKITGLEHIDKVVRVDQSPIGRTPRSNPATYTDLFTAIRNLFIQLPEAKIRGYKAGRFSFNVRGGRCETCQGKGQKIIAMNFLPDVYVPCDICFGKRYNKETLEVRYRGHSISDVLDMTINQAVEFFENIPRLKKLLISLQEVGLGYITLGQSSTTLSGGEAQRVKLASELSKRATGNTMYILDEPTTGLHFEDIHILLEALQKLVEQGNTVVIIEHNMDIIKAADHIIDLGPEGGKSGGHIVCAGTPKQVAQCQKSYTGQFLKKEI